MPRLPLACTRTIGTDRMVCPLRGCSVRDIGWCLLDGRGRYRHCLPGAVEPRQGLGYWLTYRLGGQILGGAINLGLNADINKAGKVSYTVFEVFIALQAGRRTSCTFLEPTGACREEGPGRG